MADLPISAPRLSAMIEGVEASLVTFGRVVRVVVPAEALQRHFGASIEPESWLEAFERNSAAIERAARRARTNPGRDVVILHEF